MRVGPQLDWTRLSFLIWRPCSLSPLKKGIILPPLPPRPLPSPYPLTLSPPSLSLPHYSLSSRIYVVISLLDFGMANKAKTTNGVQTGGRASVINNPTRRAALLSRVIAPILTRYMMRSRGEGGEGRVEGKEREGQRKNYLLSGSLERGR